MSTTASPATKIPIACTGVIRSRRTSAARITVTTFESEVRMAAIASGPTSSAARYEAVASMSASPIPNIAGHRLRETRQGCRRTRMKVPAVTIDATRTVTTGLTSTSFEIPFITIGNIPNSSPVTMPYQSPLGRPSAGYGENDTSTTPVAAARIPAIASADGMPSMTNPKMTGSAAVIIAAIGMTTVILATLSPR